MTAPTTAPPPPPPAVPAPDGRACLPVVGSLSPSRAGDFMACPLLYRFRTIDRLPQTPSPAATRGTVVHAALEALFDLPAAERTLERAVELVGPAWDAVRAAEPEVAAMFADDAELATWLDSARALLDGYFALEDPTRLEPAAREQVVEVVLEGGLRLRGIIDRLDVASTGGIRVVDYKGGRAPREAFEGKALFQMKFYALVLWRTTGIVPRLLQLMYLGDRQILRYAPDEADLLAVERKVLALWDAIETATRRREFRPNPSRLCDWCDHQALCPAFGGTPPPFPDVVPGPDVLLPYQQRAHDRSASAATPADVAGLAVQTGPDRLAPIEEQP